MFQHQLLPSMRYKKGKIKDTGGWQSGRAIGRLEHDEGLQRNVEHRVPKYNRGDGSVFL